MKNKKNIWPYLTAIVVILLALNPETIELAVVINMIGLDFFLILVQIQMIFVFKAFVGHSLFVSLAERGHQMKSLILNQYPQVVLMNLLVFTAMFCMVINSL